MRRWSRGRLSSVVIAGVLAGAAAEALWAREPDEPPTAVPLAEYAIYDRIVSSKFLTSQTELVLISRDTVTTLNPLDKEQIVSRRVFAEQHFFEDRLPASLVMDFVLKNRQPARLTRRFNFGVAYRLVSPDGSELPEVSLIPIPVRCGFVRSVMCDARSAIPTQAPPRIGVLAWSRVAFSQQGDEALVYVGDHRPDGTGAGMLIWLRRTGRDWMFVDTEVVWTVAPDAGEARGEPQP